jgi:hypothetical protein
MKTFSNYINERLVLKKDDAFKDLTFDDVYEMIGKTIKNKHDNTYIFWENVFDEPTEFQYDDKTYYFTALMAFEIDGKHEIALLYSEDTKPTKQSKTRTDKKGKVKHYDQKLLL